MITHVERAAVLLSGGLDSSGALHWARENFAQVMAISFQYGQPHEAAELAAARSVAASCVVPLVTLPLTVPGVSKLLADGGVVDGISAANVPGRNLIFLSSAAAFCVVAEEAPWALVVGCNASDALKFPDCRPAFLNFASQALTLAMPHGSPISVVAPWALLTKAEILAWCRERPAALADCLHSVSCYRGTGCGSCGACAERAEAFATLDVIEV